MVAQALRDVLAACPYSDNDVWLHSDPALMPVRQDTWSSWNFLGSSAPGSGDAAVCVTYWLNLLQVRPLYCLSVGVLGSGCPR